MTQQLQGHVALVTGAGQGEGQGIARTLAEAGASLVVAQRGVQKGKEEAAFLRDHYGVDAVFVATDVAIASEVSAMENTTVDRFGSLAILVNNAGASVPKRLEKHSDEEMMASFDLNY